MAAGCRARRALRITLRDTEVARLRKTTSALDQARCRVPGHYDCRRWALQDAGVKALRSHLGLAEDRDQDSQPGSTA